jgi:hypothetical protein
MVTEFWLQKSEGRRKNDVGVDGDNIKIDFKKLGYVWTGFIWLRIRFSGEIL